MKQNQLFAAVGLLALMCVGVVGQAAVRTGDRTKTTADTAYASMPQRTWTQADIDRTNWFDTNSLEAKALAKVRSEVASKRAAYLAELNSTTLSKAATSISLHLPVLPSHLRQSESVKPLEGALGQKLYATGRTRELGPLQQKSLKQAVWQQIDGGYVWRVSVTDTYSSGIRSKLDIPEQLQNAQLRVAGVGGQSVTQAIAVTTHNGSVWGGYTEGDTQTIEVFSAHNPGMDVQPKLVETTHYFQKLEPRSSASIVQKSGACNKDVQCGSGNAALNAAMAETKKSVFKMDFVVDGGAFACSGNLLNSQTGGRVMMQTANHCIGRESAAASATFFFFRETTACGSDLIDAAKQKQVPGGAKFLFTNPAIDSTLLEMNQPPPAGVVLGGWTVEPLVDGDSVIALSHPQEDPIKFARGTMVGRGFVTLLNSFSYPQDMYFVTWSQGRAEQGSSGSALLKQRASDGQLLIYGVLSSGTDDVCDATRTDGENVGAYGRFELFHPQVAAILAGGTIPADDAGNTIKTARSIGFSSTTTARLEYGGDLDVFKVDVSRSGLLSFLLTSNNVDFVSTLLDANGELVASSDDAQAGDLNPGLSYRVSPGTYYIAISHFDALGVGSYTLQTRLDDVTNNYTDVWWNPSESGWGVNIGHQGNVLFSVIYTYERDGSPVWLAASAVRGSLGIYSGDLIKVSGPAFNANPWNPAAVTRTPVGRANLVFTDKDSGVLSYTYQGTTVTKSISRFQYGRTKTECDFTIFDRSYAQKLQDLWWVNTESGWGMTVAEQDTTLFTALYVYDATGKPLWLVASDVKFANGSYSGDLFSFRGPAFDATRWTAATPTKVGTIRVAEDVITGNLFNSAKATLTYTVNGATVTKKIERFNFDPIRSECRTAR
jgi:lysyl endopeptidase